MFVLDSTIQIGNLTFNQVVEVRIVKSVDLLSDTAKIQLPTKFTLKGQDNQVETERQIKTGDPVSITLRYLGKFEKEEFTGYVTSVKPNTPVVIECEDAIWKIRRKSCFKNFRNAELKEILAYIVEGTGVGLSGDIPAIKFDKFLLKNVNGAQALQKIKEEYGLSIFIDDNGNLFAGLRQTEGTGERVAYDLEYNIVKNDLEYKDADQTKIKLKARAWKANNTFIEVEVGDPDGEQRVWQTAQIQTKAELKKVAESKLNEMRYDGYSGDVTGYLLPYATRGMVAELTNEQYPERSGNYFIPEVDIYFGKNGARRKVKVGRKV